MENLKFKQEDGLDFHCEACGDREGGCSKCGFGKKTEQARKAEEEALRRELEQPANDEEIEQFFKEIKDITE